MMFDPNLAPDALRDHLAGHARHTLVVCYCAAWCDTCREYQPQFQALSQQWPQHTFIWVDIEENPEWLGDEDVENFPTLLVQDADGHNLFFGPQLPYISHLERLLAHLNTAPSSRAQGGPPPLREQASAWIR